MIKILNVYYVLLTFIEKDITITNALQIFLDESNRKLINTWVDKGSGFFNRSMKLWSEFNDIEIYTVIIEESLL